MPEDFEDRLEDVENKIDDHESRIDDHEDKISEYEDRIDDLEEKDVKNEDYKIFLYPATIIKYIRALIELQSKDDKDNKFYPATESNVYTYFNFLGFDSEIIKYNKDIPPNDLSYISEIISNQGWSGYYYLENSENNIILNKPINLYYGIIQIAAYFSNLHFNFTVYNDKVPNIMRSHGIDSSKLKDIDFKASVNDILSKSIKLEKAGLAPRFCLAWDSSFVNCFIDQKSLSILDILKNYFLTKHLVSVQSEFKRDFGTSHPKVFFNTRILSIYLLSYSLSILSRYKIHAWVKLLEDRSTNINYYIEYFLKFAKQEFFDFIFLKLYEHRHLIPILISRSSNMII